MDWLVAVLSEKPHRALGLVSTYAACGNHHEKARAFSARAEVARPAVPRAVHIGPSLYGSKPKVLSLKVTAI